MADPGITFNSLFQLVYFGMSTYFKTSETKTPIDPDRISEKNISKPIKKDWEVRFEFYINPVRILLFSF